MDNNILQKGFTNSEWENFAKGDLLVFMEKNGLEKVTIEDGNGRKAKLSRTRNGEWKSDITLTEKF